MKQPHRRLLLKAGVWSAFGAAANRADAADARRLSPRVHTVSGEVRGLEVAGVSLFSGIPYGGTTDGPSRFLPPKHVPSWTGVLDAITIPPRCIQGPGSVFDTAIGNYFAGGRKDKLRLAEQRESEDCLYLNVLSPGLDKSRKCPVMVYVHGGGFASGSGVIALGADGLVREQNVVLVSVNHRLNVFGYLYLGEFSARYPDSGNVGLLDLVLALRWVRDNIANFGGDPGNVTLFGESGGGAKISALMAMPAGRGLFGKAIVESGSALRVSTPEQAVETASQVLFRLGLSRKRVDELTTVPASKLFAAGLSDAEPARRLGPVLDKRSIPRQTWDPIAPDMSGDIPMIIGSCRDEATLFMGGKDGENFKLDSAGLQTKLVSYLKLPDSDVARLIEVYRSQRPDSNPSSVFFAIASDRMFRMNAIDQAERKVKQGKAAVYMYSFVYPTEMDGGKYGAFHTAELPLVLRMVAYPETETLSKQLSAAWAAFARKGNPNSDGLVKWPAYTLKTRDTMMFGLGSKIMSDPGGTERIAIHRVAAGGSAL